MNLNRCAHIHVHVHIRTHNILYREIHTNLTYKLWSTSFLEVLRRMFKTEVLCATTNTFTGMHDPKLLLLLILWSRSHGLTSVWIMILGIMHLHSLSATCTVVLLQTKNTKYVWAFSCEFDVNLANLVLPPAMRLQEHHDIPRVGPG